MLDIFVECYRGAVQPIFSISQEKKERNSRICRNVLLSLIHLESPHGFSQDPL